MPYNNTPILATDEITGTSSLPLARIRRIIAADEGLDTTACSTPAAFAITVATQQFITYLVQQTHNVVKSERKPRKQIQYKDVAMAVARHDNLEFLSDVVPRPTTYKAHMAKVRRARAASLPPGAARVTLPVSRLPDVGRMSQGNDREAGPGDEGMNEHANEERGEGEAMDVDGERSDVSDVKATP